MPHPTGNEILSIGDLSKFRYSKPDDLRRLEREQQELSWALDGRSQYDGERLFGDQMPERLQGGTAPDQDHVRTLMQKNKATLEASRPPSDLTPIQKSKYAALERDLRTDIQEGMLSASMTNDPTEYNVDMELAWQHYKSNKAIAWMNVRQILDPTNDSPFFTSIEALRPTEAPKVDLRKLRMNWDHIKFTDAQERAEVEIDETVYLQFLRLKARDWSDKGIMRELGLSRAGLEVAMARLLAERVEEPGPEPEEGEDEGEGEAPGTPEAPVPPEPDEEDEEELVAVQTQASGRLVPATCKPPANLKSPQSKASWLRQQLERRHIPVKAMGRALGYSEQALSGFQVRVSKSQRLTAGEWDQIGLAFAQMDEDPAWMQQYMTETSWRTTPHKNRTDTPKSRRYGT